jgi:hypothetical protein
MMQDDDSLPTRITCEIEGSRGTTRDVEGEVWTTPNPQHTSTPFVAQTVG